MTIKEAVKDFRVWFGAGTAVIIVLGVIATFMKLPDRVDALEIKVNTNDITINDSVDRLADTVNIFIARQEAMDEGRDARESLMLQIIARRSN